MLNMKIPFLFLLLSTATADITHILKTCRDVSCDIEDGDSWSLDPDRSFEWMAAGLPMIFWKAVHSRSLFNQTNLSPECKSYLISVSNGMQQGKEWAYEFMDASGKTPAGLLRATITAVGDYDQCLDIDYGIQGKYCMTDIHHLKRSNVAGDELALHKVNTFAGYPFLSALCVPAGCDGQEIQEGVKKLLEPYMIKVAGDINCDTKESTSWIYRLSKSTDEQKISIALVFLIVTSVLVSTCIDLYHRFIWQREQEPSLRSSLSIVTAGHRLLYAKPAENFEIFAHDAMKFVIMYVSTLAHLLVCVESPLSYGTIANHHFLNDMTRKTGAQFLVNDAGLIGIPFLTGIATFSILFPMAKKAKMPYVAAIVDRITRFLPPILLLTACEFIWPIAGNGPLYTRVADFNLEKCEKNWLYNILFVNNYFLNSIDICGGHLFYSSIDMQLFLLGLIAIFLFSRSERAGVIFSMTMIIFGTVKVARSAIRYNTAFSMYVPDPDTHKISEFLQHIHMQTSSYLAAYFTGFLLSYARMNGKLHLRIQGMADHIKFLMLAGIMSYSVNFNAMLRNVFDVYPDHLNWLFISLNRLLQLLADMIIFMYVMSLKPVTGQKQEAVEPTDRVDVATKEMVCSPFKALCRLSFPLYICNYLYIRMEFFTRRFLEPSGTFWILKRLCSSTVFVYIFTIFFHLLLLSPLNAVREHLMRPRGKGKVKQHDQ